MAEIQAFLGLDLTISDCYIGASMVAHHANETARHAYMTSKKKCFIFSDVMFTTNQRLLHILLTYERPFDLSVAVLKCTI